MDKARTFLKRHSRWAGWGVSAAACLALFHALRGIPAPRLPDFNRTQAWLALGSVTVAYVLTLFVVGYAWRTILELVAGRSVMPGEIYPVFLKANLGKYFPGSVLEFAARNLLGRRLNLSHADLLASSVLEAGLTIGVLGLLLFAFLATGTVELPSEVLERLHAARLWIAAAGGAATLAALYVAGKRRAVRTYAIALAKRPWPIVFMRFALLIFVALTVAGLSFSAIVGGVLEVKLDPADVGDLMGMFLIAYCAGYLAPGAPGGLGVRESVLVWLLGSRFGEGQVLLAAALYRIACVLGDAIGFGLAPWIGSGGGKRSGA